MANHFTPEELAAELGTGTQDVIQLCVKEGIPIYKCKIDRSLPSIKARALAIIDKAAPIHGVMEEQIPKFQQIIADAAPKLASAHKEA